MLTFSQAGCGTSGCNCCINYFAMTKCSNFGLRNEHLVAHGAMLTFGLACGGAGCSYCCVNDFGMPQCGYFFLCIEHLVAYGTMLAFGLAGCGTSGLNRYVNDFGVAKSLNLNGFAADLSLANGAVYDVVVRAFVYTTGNHVVFNNNLAGGVVGSFNDCLRNEHLAAYGAVLPFCQAGCGTSGLNRCVNDFGVTKCGNFSLRNEHLVTYGAVLAFGQAGFGTSGLNRCINYFRVSECSYFFLCNEHLVAYGTMLALGQAGFGTSGLNRYVNDFGVTQCVERLCFRLTAYAGTRLLTLFGACRLFNGRPITKRVFMRLGCGFCFCFCFGIGHGSALFGHILHRSGFLRGGLTGLLHTLLIACNQ